MTITQILELVQNKASEMDTAQKLKAAGLDGQTLVSPWLQSSGKEQGVGSSAHIPRQQWIINSFIVITPTDYYFYFWELMNVDFTQLYKWIANEYNVIMHYYPFNSSSNGEYRQNLIW